METSGQEIPKNTFKEFDAEKIKLSEGYRIWEWHKAESTTSAYIIIEIDEENYEVQKNNDKLAKILRYNKNLKVRISDHRLSELWERKHGKLGQSDILGFIIPDPPSQRSGKNVFYVTTWYCKTIESCLNQILPKLDKKSKLTAIKQIYVQGLLF